MISSKPATQQPLTSSAPVGLSETDEKFKTGKRTIPGYEHVV